MSSIDILVPDLPESIANATITTWHKKPSNTVIHDEVLVEIKTDKVVLEVPASADSILDAVLEDEGTTITSHQILGRLHEGNSTSKETSTKSEEKASTPAQHQQASLEEQNNNALSPAIHRLLAEHNLNTSTIKGTSVGGHLTHEDVEKHLAKAPAKESAPAAAAPAAQPALAAHSEKHVPMTHLHKHVAEHLLEAKNSTTMLTTFNKVNMKPIMDLHKQYSEAFEKHHSIHLGFMSFYMKAVVEALKHYPEVNTSINSNDMVYHNYFNISMAVSTPHSLVTPVLHDVNTLSMADIKKKIKELAVKGHDSKLTIEDLTSGNFTITNSGVFSSLMSTPIINPPQSTILGMHTIKDHPMAVNGQVEILPMMYLALSYNHHLINGHESMGFLVTIKELLEDPTRLLLDM